MGELGVDLFHPLHVHLWGWGWYLEVFNCVSLGIFGKIVDSVCVCVRKMFASGYACRCSEKCLCLSVFKIVSV